MGTCGLVGQIGVYTGWIESGMTIGAMDWIGLSMISFILPGVLSLIIGNLFRRAGWFKSEDVVLE